MLLSWPFGTRQCQDNTLWPSCSGHCQYAVTSGTARPRPNCFGHRDSAYAHGVDLPLLLYSLVVRGQGTLIDGSILISLHVSYKLTAKP